MNNTLQIIKENNLEHDLEMLLNFNSGNSNPYHNFSHSLSVMKNIYALGVLVGLEDDKLRLMLIAGLYHDFNHSGGKFSDIENIKRALKAVDKLSTETKENKLFIKSLIRCTEYPFKEQELNKYQKIMRDADLMQWLEPNFIQHVLFGLNSELNGSYCLKKETIENMIKFMTDATIFTDQGKILIKNGIKSVIEDCNYLIEILKEKEQ